MPARASELAKIAKRIGFVKVRQKGSHVRWKHPDGRATTIPVHGKAEIGGWLFYEILEQLELSREDGKAVNVDEKIKNLNRPKMQLSIFDAHSATFDEIRNLLEAVDINRLTPVEALLKLQEIKGKVK